jgi:hypothetical protein
MKHEEDIKELSLKDDTLTEGEGCIKCSLLNALEATEVDNWKVYGEVFNIIGDCD